MSEVTVSEAFNDALDDVAAERLRQLEMGMDAYATAQEFSVNDMICVALAYLGRATELVKRNEREGHDQREMLVKAATTLVATIEMMDTDQLFASGVADNG